jgi:hypothetical protein
MMVVSADRLSQLLKARELAARGCVAKIRRELAELTSSGCIAVTLGRLRSALQVRGDLLYHLLVLARIRLLKLLESADRLGHGRELPLIGQVADTTCASLGRQGSALKGRAESRL